MLINSLLSHTTETHWEEFTTKLEKLNVRKAVVVRSFLLLLFKQSLTAILQRLMSSHVIEDLKSSILDFQANEARFVLRKKHEPVDPLENPDHYELLRFIWQSSKLESSADEENSELVKWRKLGFETEDVNHEFMNVGVLGLESLVSFHRPSILKRFDADGIALAQFCKKRYGLLCKGGILRVMAYEWQLTLTNTY